MREKLVGGIPEEKINEIRDRADLVETVAAYVNLRKAGTNYVGLCPFHAEKTPSFTVSPEKRIFYCFGCRTGGNLFTFLMKVENLSFVEAVEKMADRLGISITRERGRRGRSDPGEELFRINEAVANFYHHLLVEAPEGRAARSYLEKRGLKESTIRAFRLGYAPEAWDSLVKFLRSQELSPAAGAELGLIIPKKEGGYYDRFRHRIIFPIEDARARVLGFGGRALGEELPKYMNSPDSTVYHKGENLYGIRYTLPEIKKQGEAILVEGYFDLLALYEQGIKNSVASLGTALTARQVEILAQASKKVVILYDADPAGIKAAGRGLELLLGRGLDARVSVLPQGEDPDSFVNKEGKEQILALAKEAKPVVDFLVEMALAELNPDETGYQGQVVEKVAGVLALIKDNIQRQVEADRLAQLLHLKAVGLSRSAKLFFPQLDRFADKLLAAAGSRGTAPAQQPGLVGSGWAPPAEEELLVRLMLEDHRFLAQFESLNLVEDMTDPVLKKVAEMLILKYAGDKVEPASLLDALEEEGWRGLVSRLFFLPGIGEEGEKAFFDCVRRLRLRKIKDRDEQLTLAIRAAQEKKDKGLLHQLLKEKARIKEELKSNLLGE